MFFVPLCCVYCFRRTEGGACSLLNVQCVDVVLCLRVEVSLKIF